MTEFLKKYNCSKYVVYRKLKSPWEKPLFDMIFSPHFAKIKSYHYLRGIQLEKGLIHKKVGRGLFDAVATKIPDGYNKVKTDRFDRKWDCGEGLKLQEKNNEAYKAIKAKHKGQSTYFIHDNGGRPFLVYVAKNSVSVYAVPKNATHKDEDWTHDDKLRKWMYTKQVGEYPYKKIFIGESVKSGFTNFGMGYGKEFDGNSILLKQSNSKYIHIAQHIAEVDTKGDVIKEYYAQVGNNDVPYQLGVSDKYVYFFLDGRKVAIKEFEEFNDKIKLDAYWYFYGHEGNKKLSEYSTKIKEKMLVKRWFGPQYR